MNKIVYKIHWSFLLLGLLMLYFGKGVIFLSYLFCVILHEFGHSLVGRKLGYKLNVITLLPYGASLSGNNAPFKTKDEILIAIAGPIVNLILMILMMALWWILPESYSYTQVFFSANFSTLIFNFLPVFPLDGGRVLLAVLNNKINRVKAFKIVKIIGSVITAVFFVLFFISFFGELNYMLGINSLFLLIGLLDDDNSIYYINVNSFADKTKLLNNGLLVKTIAISENATIYDAFKLMDKNNVTQIFVMDSNYKIKQSLLDNQLQKIILTNSLDTKLKNIKHF